MVTGGGLRFRSAMTQTVSGSARRSRAALAREAAEKLRKLRHQVDSGVIPDDRLTVRRS